MQNDPELISSLVSYLSQVLRDLELFDEADCHRIATALDEALTNACYHGNLEVRSEVREHDSRAYRALADKRRTVAPYRDRRIRVSTDLTSHEARFVCSLTSCCNLSGASPDDGRFPVRPSSLTLTGRWRHVPVQARVTKLCGGEVKSWRLFLVVASQESEVNTWAAA